MEGFSELYMCSEGKVFMAQCDEGCRRCTDPFENIYGYVPGDCNRDFLRAECTDAEVEGVEFDAGFKPTGVYQGAAAGGGTAAGTEEWPDDAFDENDGLTRAERMDTDLGRADAEEEQEERRGPLSPKADSEKFHSKKYTDGPLYDAAAHGAQRVQFAGEARRESLRACGMLEGALKTLREIHVDSAAAAPAADKQAEAQVALALQRCEKLRAGASPVVKGDTDGGARDEL
eukprot:g2550.t1